MELGILRKKISNCESRLSIRESSWQISKWVRSNTMCYTFPQEIISSAYCNTVVLYNSMDQGTFQHGVQILRYLSLKCWIRCRTEDWMCTSVVQRNPDLNQDVRGSNFGWTRFPGSNVFYKIWTILFSLFPIQYLNSMFLRNKEDKFEEWATRNAESAIDWTSTCC